MGSGVLDFLGVGVWVILSGTIFSLVVGEEVEEGDGEY